MPETKKILMVAGEASGDLHASSLIKEINKLKPRAKFFGLGGQRMKQAGVDISFDLTGLAVVGLWEVLKNLRKFIKIFNDLLKMVDSQKPDLAILVDYPGFNLRLAKELKKRNIPIIYYISPQVWAWGKKRIKIIKETVDKIIVFFKFEEEFYRKEGIHAVFVGHPLLDEVNMIENKEKTSDKLGLVPTKFTVALLPGSREKEVKNILPVMLDTARLIQKNLPSVKFLILRSSAVKKEAFEPIVSGYGLPIYILSDSTYEGLSVCDFAMVASGTATLETALLGVPMAILYRVSFLSWLYLKSAIKVPHIGLVNIVARGPIAAEFIQYKARPKKIAGHITDILTNPSEQYRIKQLLSDVKRNLGEKGACGRAAAVVAKELQRL